MVDGRCWILDVDPVIPSQLWHGLPDRADRRSPKEVVIHHGTTSSGHSDGRTKGDIGVSTLDWS